MADDLSLKILNKLSDATSRVRQSSERLSSGKRINRAVDDAAGLAIQERLAAEVRTLGQSQRNNEDAQSAIQVASSALSSISDISSRLKELSTQASNGTYSDEQRQFLQAEYDALSQEAARITETTEFNGIKLLKGDTFTAQVGTDSSSGSQIQVNGSDTSALVSSLRSQNISTQAGAQAALDSIDSFIASASQRLGDLGAASSRLESANETTAIRRETAAGAAARIGDADIAAEKADNVASLIRQNAGTAMLAQAGNLQRDTVLKLLS